MSKYECEIVGHITIEAESEDEAIMAASEKNEREWNWDTPSAEEIDSDEVRK